MNSYNIIFETRYPSKYEGKITEDILAAAYYGDLDGIKRAVEEAPDAVKFSDKFTGSTALHISASLGNYSCVEFLVNCSGIDLFQKDNDGNEALAYAYEIGHYAIADLLADRMFPNRHLGKKFFGPEV